MSIKESALNTIAALTNSDFVRMVTSAGASRKATLQSIAQHIIETYAGSSLAGSNQSVKAALDGLNSTLGSVKNETIRMTVVQDYTVTLDALALYIITAGKLNTATAATNGLYICTTHGTASSIRPIDASSQVAISIDKRTLTITPSSTYCFASITKLAQF